MAEVDMLAVSRTAWGDQEVPSEIIQRWLQGFEFHDSEPCALVQKAGGPCGIIAPVQGFILKRLVFGDNEVPGGWRQPEDRDTVLAETLAELLVQASTATQDAELTSATERQIAVVTCAPPDEGEATLNVFHRNASTCWCSHEDASSIILSVLDAFSGQYGILCFLYSLLLSRGLEMVEKDQGFENEPLIALPFGHANQALLNLVLCGLAVPNPWDGKKDMDGIVLNGIPKRNAIGYLTLLESLRYTACGSYYKTPAWPIWVLASETHFSVLFSLDKRLIELDSPRLHARAAFEKVAETGSGMLPVQLVRPLVTELSTRGADGEILALLALGEQQFMQKFDPDNLGVVLLPHFLNTLYPGQVDDGTPEQFVVYHYNGIAPPGGKVQFLRGQAKSAIASDVGAPDIMKVLWTKWSPLTVEWDGDVPNIR